MAGIMGEISNNLLGLQSIAQNSMVLDQQKKAIADNADAANYLRKYQESAQTGAPDFQSLNEAIIRSPELSKSVLDGIGIQDRRQLQDAASFITGAFGKLNDPEALLSMAQSRANYLTANNRDPANTNMLIESIRSGDMAKVKNDLTAVGAALVNQGAIDKDIYAQVAGIGTQGGNAVASSNILDDGTTVQVMRNGETRVTNAAGQEVTGEARVQAIRGAQNYGAAIQSARAGGRQQAISDVDLTMKPLITNVDTQSKVNAQGNTERSQKFIDDGIAAAQAVPVIKRSLELLDTVKTGGLQNSLLGAKNYFGVTGADEAELSYNLGKSVVSQLRTTFGAAFTEKDRESLAAIEAGFGKSTEGNRRLLKQLESIVRVKSKAGLNAASKAGDSMAEEQINEYLNSDYSGEAKTEGNQNAVQQESYEAMKARLLR